MAINPWKEAAESMQQAGITSLGQSFSPTFEPELNYHGVDREHYFKTPGAADRIDYGYGQMMNPQGGARQIGPWINDDYYVNPNIFEDQKGLASFPGGARTFAERHRSGDFTNWDNLGDFRNMIDWMSNLGAPVDSPVDQYGYDLSGVPNWDSDMFKSKREQIEEARESGIYGDYIADQMEMYGRDNPYTQDLSKTTPNKGVFRDLGYSVRIPQEIATGYGQNLGDQYRYSSDRQPGISDINDPLQYLPSDRQPGLNDYLAGSPPPGAVDVTPSDLREGLTYPEGIGLDRSPEEILSVPEVKDPDDPSWWDKISPFIPPVPTMPYLSKGTIAKTLDFFSPNDTYNDIYQDPIMNMAAGDIPAEQMSEFDMSEADSYSPQNLIQLYQDALDAGNEDEAEMYLNDLQLRYPTLV